MIIREITVEDFGLFREARTFTFVEGINLLIGPNESGKSTLSDALRMAFFEKHNTQSGRILQLVPWGSSLAPKVSVVFDSRGAQYRITKQFMSNARSSLEKYTNGTWQKLSTEDAADKATADLVCGKVPGRGGSKPEHWGLAQVLWAKQGELFPEGKVNEDTKSRIQSIFGVIASSNEENKIVNKIYAIFDSNIQQERRYFKSGSDPDCLDKQISQLETRKRDLEISLIEHEKSINSLEEARGTLSEREDGLAAAKQLHEDAEKDRDQAAQHERNRLAIASETEILEHQHLELFQKVKKINDDKERLEKGEKDVQGKKEQITDWNERIAELSTKLQNAQDDLAKLKQEIQEKQDELTIVRQVWDALRNQKDLEKLSAALARANALENDKKKLSEEMTALRAPSQEGLKALNILKTNIGKKLAQLEAIGLSVRISAENSVNGEIVLDGHGKYFNLAPGAVKECKAAQVVNLRLEGIAEFEVKSGYEDAQKMQKELDDLKEEFSAILTSFEANDVSELETRIYNSIEIGTQLKGIENSITEIAPDGIGELDREAKKLRKHIKDNWGRIPDASPYKQYQMSENANDAGEAVTSLMVTLEEEINGLQKREKALNKAVKELQADKDQHDNSLREEEYALRELIGELKTMERELTDFRADGLIDEDRIKELDLKGYNLEIKRKALERLNQEKETFEDLPKQKIKAAEKRFEQAQQLVNDISKEIATMEGQLSEQAKQGTYTMLAATEEELTALKEKERKVKTTMRAYELLCDLYKCHKRDASQTVMEPLTKKVSAELQRLISPSYKTIKLNDDYMPHKVQVAEWDKEVDLDPLSYGTREQITFLTRLALGEMLSHDEKQLVILDDPLTNTYISRLKVAMEILREASKKVQLLILTCHPAQYTDLLDNNVIQA